MNVNENKARQIWIEGENTINTWMCLVKDFEYETSAENAIIKVAADSKYRLYVNGQEVLFEGGIKRGPSKHETYYDLVDISSFLHSGTNRVAFLVCFFGDDGFSHVSSGKGGLYVESDFLWTDRSWKALKHPAFITPEDDEPSNFRLAESNEYFDASKDIGNWMNENADVSSWQNADEICPSSFGELQHRIIPFFKDFGRKKYVNSDDYVNYTTTEDTVLEMRLPYNAQIMPYLKVKASMGKKITVKADNYRDNLYDTNGVMMGYFTKDGVQEYEFFSWLNGEYMFYSVPKGVTICELGYRETGYDADFKDLMPTGDEFLDKLMKKAQRTLYITMRDNFMDCPDRERAQWWGDVNLEMQMIRYSLDDKAFLLYKKGVISMVKCAKEAGHMLTVVPSGKDQFELPMQNLAGIYGFSEYYKITGDIETIKLAYPMAVSYLKLFDMDNNLVSHRKGSWDWPDWGDNADINVMDNAWYYMALKSALNMANILKENADLSFITDRMAQIESSFNQNFWNGEYYYDHTDNNKPDDRANALAVLAGLADKEKFSDIMKILRTVENSSPYMEYYVLEAMCQMGYTDDAIARIKRRYKPMVDENYSTLWEYWNTEGTKNHAWSGGPLIIVSKYLLQNNV